MAVYRAAASTEAYEGDHEPMKPLLLVAKTDRGLVFRERFLAQGDADMTRRERIHFGRPWLACCKARGSWWG